MRWTGLGYLVSVLAHECTWCWERHTRFLWNRLCFIILLMTITAIAAMEMATGTAANIHLGKPSLMSSLNEL